MSKRAAGASEEAARGSVDSLEITPLGAGSEVGRSCILLSYKGKNVRLACGSHPGLAGLASLPYFDDVDLSTVRSRTRNNCRGACADAYPRRRSTCSW